MVPVCVLCVLLQNLVHRHCYKCQPFYDVTIVMNTQNSIYTQLIQSSYFPVAGVKSETYCKQNLWFIAV
jgi:hypothetical protein